MQPPEKDHQITGPVAFSNEYVNVLYYIVRTVRFQRTFDGPVQTFNIRGVAALFCYLSGSGCPSLGQVRLGIRNRTTWYHIHMWHVPARNPTDILPCLVLSRELTFGAEKKNSSISCCWLWWASPPNFIRFGNTLQGTRYKIFRNSIFYKFCRVKVVLDGERIKPENNYNV